MGESEMIQFNELSEMSSGVRSPFVSNQPWAIRIVSAMCPEKSTLVWSKRFGFSTLSSSSAACFDPVACSMTRLSTI
jgi:hypothetical protein